MVTIVLNEAEYSLPETWNEVTISQFQRLSKLDVSDKVDYIFSMLEILTELPKDVLFKIPSHQTKLIVDALGFITSQSLPKDITNDFKLGEDQYTLKPFDTLTMGEIISLEILIKDINNNIAGIISILFSKN
ncbi:MAG: hypothetical protein ACKOXB_10155, partial [Flavobacteriales bacterium]